MMSGPEKGGTYLAGPSAAEKRNRLDIAVYLLLIALGALQFFLSCRAEDFVGDAYYFELAKSLLARTGYGFNFKPQTMVPPGFASLVALFSVTIGSSYATLVRTMALFSTLALIVSYELLRAEENRVIAAVSCLLLASSPSLFAFSSRLVFSDLPYFLTSMLLLWVMSRLDSGAGRWWTRMALWLLAGVLLLASVLLRSTGLALLGGLAAWLGVSLLRERKIAKRRLKVFVPLLVAGLAVQGAWMYWAANNQSSEWPIGGYQQHYIAQLKLKNGNYPEQGLATWKDVLVRPIDNGDDWAAALVTLLVRKSTAPAWYSPACAVTLGVLILGLGYSFLAAGGGLLEWYFLGYATMFMFWPWGFELRFLVPLMPLACLYLWRGGVLLWRWALCRPRETGVAGLIVATIGCLSTILWGWQVPKPQPRWCIAVWTLAGALSIALAWRGRDPSWKGAHLLGKGVSVRGRVIPLWQVLSASLLTGLFVVGVAMQLTIGWANLDFRLEDDGFYPDIEAAKWIGAHSASSSVVMARKEDLVYHYSQRRVIWFPPLTDPRLLMEGIHRYHIQYIVVAEGNDNYWNPPAVQCFNLLSQAYPGVFREVHQGPHNHVFEVSAK